MTASSPASPPQAFAVPIQLRFGDMDAYGHINNVAVLRLLEESRCRLFAAQAAWQGVRVLVARQEVEYRAVLEYDGSDVQVRLWTSRVGGSSFELSYVLADHGGQTTAVAATTIVVIDEAGRPAPIPVEARAKLDKLAGPPIPFRGR